MTPRFQRLRAPLGVWAFAALCYVITLGPRIVGPSDNNHYVHLANSLLHGQLSVIGDRPPGNNDWALYQGRWYVAFPPLPAIVIAPAVAIWGTATWDRLFWALLSGLGPAAVYWMLRRMRESGYSARSVHEEFALTALLAFGSAFYFTAVQGTVWFAAHVVALPLTALFVGFSLGARQPWQAGLCLGLACLARPTTLLLAPVFLFEAWQAARPISLSAWLAARANDLLTGETTPPPPVDRRKLARLTLLFAAPVVVLLALNLWLNYARFDDPFEVGYRYLQIRWHARIEKWGLFNYHYLGRNLAVMLASLPWLSATAPFIKVSGHGLALWVTTPQVLSPLSPRRTSPLSTALYLSVAAVAVMDLCYQNSGWVQFGYRFSLDYMAPLLALIAVTAGRFRWGFYALLAWAIAVNTFGAISFDRMPQFYDHDATQRVMFQPD